MADFKKLAEEVVSLVGGKSNINNVYNCYTRARINVNDINKANTKKIKELPGVIGVVVDKAQVQVIVGPGKSVKLAGEIKGIVGDSTKKVDTKKETNPAENYLETKKKVRNKTNNKATSFIRKIAGIFVPIIPMFIACGLLLAIYSICEIKLGESFTKSTAGTVFNVVSTSVFFVLNIIVGYNATKEFGGDGIIGAALAGVLTNPLMNGLDGEGLNLGMYVFKTAEVGIFTILLVSIGIAYLEKLFRKFMPDMIDAFMTPFLTVIIMSIAALFILQPIGAYMNKGLAFIFRGISDHVPYLLGLVPLFYLLLVLTGTHHSLMVVSLALTDNGKVLAYIMPVQLMAGAAEVGAAIYILLRTKNKGFKKTIISALPIGVLGIDEPLIWGMSVPLKSPFISAGIGGFIGGTFLACMRVGSKLAESTGIQAAFVTNRPGIFAIGFIMSIVAGFIVQALIGFKDPVEDGNAPQKTQYSIALTIKDKFKRATK